ncbi:hypothetical protein ABW20_dc0108583 [Dactylellina cionopaga]|nr:hypothetical protein ABW20_dc0108583 [Dactylellina cionopaga]
MGLQRPQRPQRSTFHGLPTPPPSTPLSLPPLTPLASTVNIHITNHNHFSIQTPPSSSEHQSILAFKNRASLLSSTTTPQRKAENRSPLLKRIIQNLSPIYSYLTPAATPAASPLQRVTSITLTGEENTKVDTPEVEQPADEQERDLGESEREYDDYESRLLEAMTPAPTYRFSASASNRNYRNRHDDQDSIFSPLSPAFEAREETEEAAEQDISTFSQYGDDELTIIGVSGLQAATPKKKTKTKRKYQKPKKQLPQCYDHDLRFPNDPPGCDVVPCDWVRPYNSQRFNNYTNGDVQCRVPKCDTCISHETYGDQSIWKLSAPPGHTAESHRLRSRIRYLCSRCPQPAPSPPGGIGPIEMCTCVLRDVKGLPTDLWFQCQGCAEAAWFEHDSKYGGPDGVLVTRKRARRRKNKYGVIVRPRSPGTGGVMKIGKGKSTKRVVRKEWRVKRCACGRIAPRDGRHGAWCTWCQCPVDGIRGMELGGAATGSGPSFLAKSDEEEKEESKQEDKLDEADFMEDDEDKDSGIGL